MLINFLRKFCYQSNISKRAEPTTHRSYCKRWHADETREDECQNSRYTLYSCKCFSSHPSTWRRSWRGANRVSLFYFSFLALFTFWKPWNRLSSGSFLVLKYNYKASCLIQLKCKKLCREDYGSIPCQNSRTTGFHARKKLVNILLYISSKRSMTEKFARLSGI